MKSIGRYSGGNTEFVEKVSAIAGKELNCRGTKQRMNRWKDTLEDLGVYFDQTDSTPGKDKFYVASHFKGKTTIEERLADLMVEDLYGESSERSEETKNQ